MKRPLLRNLTLHPYSGLTQDISGNINPPEESDGDGMTFVLEDPEGFAPQLAIPTDMAVLLTLFDGQHTLPEIAADFAELTGVKLSANELVEMVGHFDTLHMLDSPAFHEFLQAEIDEFRRLSVRPARMAGGAYEEEPHMLRLQLENVLAIPAKIRQAEGTAVKEKPIRAVIVPHLDPHRGAASYGWAYEAIRDRNASELFIIFGTSHNPMKQPFALTAKSFATPIGTLSTDAEFVARTAEKFADIDVLADEFVHRDEHSVEFQAIFLRHAVANVAKREIRIVPILVNSGQRFMEAKETPENSLEIRALAETLAELIREEESRTGKPVCVIAAVDFSHAGPIYGQREEVDAAAQDRLREEDTRLFERILASDTSGFWADIPHSRDKFHGSGLTPVLVFMELLKTLGVSECGELLSYEQAVDEETRSCVTFAAMVF